MRKLGPVASRGWLAAVVALAVIAGFMAGTTPQAIAASSGSNAALAARNTVSGGTASRAAGTRTSGSGGTAKTAGSPSGNTPLPVSHPVRRVCGGSVTAGHAQCMALERTDVAGHTGLYPASTSGPAGYGPADLRSAYDLPASSTAVTVAIVDAYDDPNAEADLAIYRQQYGLPACTSDTGCFTKVAQDGSTNYPSPDPNWAGEISLDLDMVSATCPYCHILLVEASDNTSENLGAAVNEAVALGAGYISNSYGGPEVSWQGSFDKNYNHPGVVITASTGDTGYGAQFPAASPYVTAVGGTTLTADQSTVRGWSETAWSDGGSGCSAYETKPRWQKDSGCSHRSIADVSAVADPNTGVAVYDTWDASGWGVDGGTSVAAPLIASVYALAGAPAAGSYPSSYPYAAPDALNDITSGGNSGCSKSSAYLCTAGQGYDGPTGLGTPDGLSAFRAGPHGIVSGVLTSAADGRPVGHAEVDVGTAGRAFTDGEGKFAASVAPGSYQVAITAFGYATQTLSGVQVTAGGTTTEKLTLQPLASATVSGTITDGSGHGWPLYASVSVPGTPAIVYTNPATGRYSLSLPDNASYTLAVSSVYPGYQDVTEQVQVATSGQTVDVSVPVNASACSAPGYQTQFTGSTQTFDASTAPDGWTVTSINPRETGWEFDNPNGLPNNTGGSGNFAVGDAEYRGSEDTELISPVSDLTADTSPVLKFDSDLIATFGDTASIDVSIDGGQTWTNVWQIQNYPGRPGPDTETVPLPQAAGQSQVQVRFHYQSLFGYFWEIDNVFLGDESCGQVPGGLVEGRVLDGNTGAGVDGATVTEAGTGATATTMPNPAGSGVGNGFYFLFSPAGTQSVSASMLNYVTAAGQAGVTADGTTAANLTLQAGQLSVTPVPVSVTEPLGRATTKAVQFTNTGQAPVDVRLYQQPGSFTAAGAGGSAAGASGSGSAATQPSAKPASAPLHRVNGHYSPLPQRATAQKAATGTSASTAKPAGAAWTSITDYPIPVMDNAVATDPATGLVYSVGGLSNGLQVTSAGYVYDPGTGQWSQLPSMPQALEAPVAAFIDGKLYVAGGWNSTGIATSRQLEIYDPDTRTWSAGADIPTGYAGSGVAVLNGQIYVIGGCDGGFCGYRDVHVYNPVTDTWADAAPYPVTISWAACGALDGSVYCAGGLTNSADGTATNAGYSYSPATGQWSPIQGLPIDLWGMSYATANGRLLVSGGVTNGENTVTNQGFAYDPSAGTWSALPNSVNTDYRAGGGCGFYRVGGSPYGSSYETIAEQLPGYDSCSGTSVPWLSQSTDTFTLSPGQSVTVTLTLSATGAAVSQPGSYTANLVLSQDTPYTQAPVGITMTATVPAGWSRVGGTVTGLSCGSPSAPLPGATVEIYGSAKTGSLVKTGTDGSYSLWVPSSGKLTVIAALDGWQPQVQYPSGSGIRTEPVNFALTRDGGGSCS